MPNTPMIHIHLHVTHLENSRRFYENLFGEPPVKVRPDHIKFLPVLGPLNLALSPAKQHHPEAGHFGIQVDSPDIVRDELARVREAGLETRVETAVNCCHSNQDKFWVTDPDGTQWEIYNINHDLPESDSGPADNEGSCPDPMETPPRFGYNENPDCGNTP